MSNSAIKSIVASLNEVFAPMDAEVLEATKEWATKRMAAVAAFKESEEAALLRAKRNSSEYYGRIFHLAGGKTWYNALTGRNEEGRNEVVAKHCAAVAAHRNQNIAAKLAKAGVSEVESTTYTRTSDGFNGTFAVITDAGRKVVTVDTIRAGGYNIQCLHLRVLTKVR